MQSKIVHRYVSRFAACCAALAVLGTSLILAAEFKPFVTLQLAGPGTLISIAEKVASIVEDTEFSASIAQAAPYKNLPGVNANGSIGLAISPSDTPYGVDAIVSLPISDFEAFTIPGLEMEVTGFRAALTRTGNKYTLAGPFGTVSAYQQAGFLVIATEGADEIAATADQKNLFADVSEFTLGVHVNLEALTEEQIAKIWGPIALMLAMQGMDVPDPTNLSEVLGPAAEQIKDWAAATVGITIDPRTLNLTGTANVVAKTGTELADKFAKSKDAQAKTGLGSFLVETPETVFAWHYLNYFTETEIKTAKEMLDLVGAGLLEGLNESIEDGGADKKQLEKVIKVAEAAIEIVDDSLNFVAREKLLDTAFWLDSQGTFIMAAATDKTDELTALDEKFYGTLLTIFEEDGIKTFIEGKMKRDYETVAGYSLSCIPNLFSDLPAGIVIPDEVKEVVANIPLSLIWGVKTNETLVYAVGLDFAKTEQTLKAVLGRAPTPPTQTGVIAMKPLAEFVLNTIVPLIPEMDAANIQKAQEIAAPLLKSANAKIVYTEEYPVDSYHQKFLVNGELITACIGFMKPAVAEARGAARRMQCSNHLKILGLTLHNYHDAYGGVPPLYTVDAEGKPLHSWRVLILPFIEQTALYEQIRLNEPWDSPHNKQFHNVVVPYFSCPDNPLVAPGKSCTYSAIADASLRPALPDSGQRPRDSFANYQDGLSNQIFFVEVKEPFNWMDPTADVTLDEFAKGVNAGRVGSFHPNGCNVCLGDGAVRFIADTVAPAILRALGDPRDGRSVTLP